MVIGKDKAVQHKRAAAFSTKVAGSVQWLGDLFFYTEVLTQFNVWLKAIKGFGAVIRIKEDNGTKLTGGFVSPSFCGFIF